MIHPIMSSAPVDQRPEPLSSHLFHQSTNLPRASFYLVYAHTHTHKLGASKEEREEEGRAAKAEKV